MDFTRRHLLAAAAVGLAMPSLVRASPHDAALWEVRNGSAKVYLFGGIGGMRAPWSSPRIEAALAESATMWKETPEQGPSATQRLLARGIDRKTPLSTWLTPSQRSRVADAAVKVGSTSAFIEPFRPWLAAQFLENQFYAHFGFKGQNGPEPRLTSLAKLANKSIRTEFPDDEAMLALFAGLTPAAEVQLLLRAVDDIETGPEEAERVVEAWAAGNLSLETKEALRLSAAYPELFEAYAVSRNRLWPARIRGMLDGGGTTFVMVGSGHLVGPQSIQDLLTGQGMRVRRV